MCLRRCRVLLAIVTYCSSTVAPCHFSSSHRACHLTIEHQTETMRPTAERLSQNRRIKLAFCVRLWNAWWIYHKWNSIEYYDRQVVMTSRRRLIEAHARDLCECTLVADDGITSGLCLKNCTDVVHRRVEFSCYYRRAVWKWRDVITRHTSYSFTLQPHRFYNAARQ